MHMRFDSGAPPASSGLRPAHCVLVYKGYRPSPLLCQKRATDAPKALPLHFQAEEPPAPGGVDGDFKMAVFGDKGVGL